MQVLEKHCHVTHQGDEKTHILSAGKETFGCETLNSYGYLLKKLQTTFISANPLLTDLSTSSLADVSNSDGVPETVSEVRSAIARLLKPISQWLCCQCWLLDLLNITLNTSLPPKFCKLLGLEVDALQSPDRLDLPRYAQFCQVRWERFHCFRRGACSGIVIVSCVSEGKDSAWKDFSDLGVK